MPTLCLNPHHLIPCRSTSPRLLPSQRGCGPVGRILCTIIVCVFAGINLSLVSRTAIAQELLPQIYSSNCELNGPVNLPVLCLRPEATASALSDTSSSKTRFHYLGWKGYAGLHLFPQFSLHFQDNYSEILAPRLDLRSVYHHDLREYYLTVGQVTSSKPRLLMGHFTMPFGLVDEFRPRIFELQYTSGLFQEGPADAVQFTYDNLVNVRLDLAAGKDNRDDLEPLTRGDLHKFSLRAIYDFSAMQGTRMIGSYFRDDHQETSKIGLALYNNQDDSDGESFVEWVRISNNWRKPFTLQAQMISAGYRQPMQKQGRSVIRYEYLQGIHRMLDLGYELDLSELILLSGFVSFERKNSTASSGPNTILTSSFTISI